MFSGFFRRDPEADAIATGLYGAIVAQARSPALYADMGVADTVDGRFEMVILHLILVLDRLVAGDAAAKALAQKVFDLHCTDMDRSLRELGIGDLGVPKRMKKMAESFYGRAGVYRPALAAGDRAALVAAIGRNVFPGVSDAPGAPPLADYVLASVGILAGFRPGEALRFADPADFARQGAAA